MSEKTSTYLFNESTLFQKFVSVENNMDKLDEIDNEILEKLTSLKEQFEDFNNKEKQKYKPTLNELLDKINTSGITKLSKEELNLLNEYSKSL
jgi:S-adenosylmethionine:diacylglycerol 3-amino-3-carboxypropyl transferase